MDPMDVSIVWIGIGLLGQAMFSLRFLVQWWRSERAGKSVVPLAFWYLSLAGGVILLSYAIHRRDPVFIVGQATGVLVYLRNLQLIYRQRAPA
jgi:lipid-A-disaccharide synthase-like uncharacterized protein